MRGIYPRPRRGGVMSEFLNPLFVVSGFGVGFIVGLTGVGGGSLMTPVLIFLFGVHPGTAVGTDLLYACGTKTAGTWVHNIHHNIDWPLVGRLALGGLPAAPLALRALPGWAPAPPVHLSRARLASLWPPLPSPSCS